MSVLLRYSVQLFPTLQKMCLLNLLWKVIFFVEVLTVMASCAIVKGSLCLATIEGIL